MTAAIYLMTGDVDGVYVLGSQADIKPLTKHDTSAEQKFLGKITAFEH